MDQVTQVKNQFRAEQWTQLIKECQSSGMRVDDWCIANDISRHAYYYWLRKLRLANIRKSESAVLVETPKQEPAVFKKLEVSTPVPNTKAAVIIRLNGATVEISEGTSQQTIQAVLLALHSVC